MEQGTQFKYETRLVPKLIKSLHFVETRSQTRSTDKKKGETRSCQSEFFFGRSQEMAE